MNFDITKYLMKLVPTAIVAGLLAFVVGLVLSMLETTVTGVFGVVVALILIGVFGITAMNMRKGEENVMELTITLVFVSALLLTVSMIFPVPALAAFNLKENLSVFNYLVLLSIIALSEAIVGNFIKK